jgi:hypothetical protein
MYSMKSLKSGTASLMNRNRPFIEKISTSNKNHLPAPPVGKTVGHGYA